MQIEAFFDARTWTLSYLVYDETSRDAVIIDPVLDFDPLRVKVFTESIERYLSRIHALGLTLRWSLDTHAHADHISAGAELRDRLGARLAIGARITEVQALFGALFGRADLPADGSQFDRLVDDGDVIDAGALSIKVIATPGHTPACVTYQIGDALFTGDALFMPDFGTGRCDFPRGSATELYASVKRLYGHPDSTRIFVGHDYQPGGRPVAWMTTVGESKASNIQLRGDTDEQTFVGFRKARDATLSPPNLIFQSIQCNIDAGRLPPPSASGQRYLLMPMGVFK